MSGEAPAEGVAGTNWMTGGEIKAGCTALDCMEIDFGKKITSLAFKKRQFSICISKVISLNFSLWGCAGPLVVSRHEGF